MRRGAFLAPVLAALLLLTGCTEAGVQVPQPPDEHGGGVEEWTRPTGKPIDFDGPTVDGATFRSSAQRGHVVVVNFWYKNCGPCNAEAATLTSTAKRFSSEGVRFVGINTEDGASDARSFEQKYGTPYPSILDQRNQGAARLAFQASGLPPSAIPTTVVLDRNGRMTARILGQVTDESTLRTLIESALDERDA